MSCPNNNNSNTNQPASYTNIQAVDTLIHRFFSVTSPASSNRLNSSEEAANYSQFPHSTQKQPLSTFRLTSSIPRADDLQNPPSHQINGDNNNNRNKVGTCPHHTQAAAGGTESSRAETNPGKSTKNLSSEGGGTCPHAAAAAGVKSRNWVYPSEQQFYNAMKRKGYSPQEEEMSAIVAIHNTVNEQTWSKVLAWEEFAVNDPSLNNPRLIRFEQKVHQISPKAWYNYLVKGYKKPFDRHDWYVDRYGDGSVTVRYVIDFYNGNNSSNMMMGSSVYLDVRPAVDNVDNAIDRVKMAMKEVWDGRS